MKESCNTIVQQSISQKIDDLSGFTLPITIHNVRVGNTLIDWGASINLRRLSVIKRISDINMKPTKIILQHADKPTKSLVRIAKNISIKVHKFLFPMGFIVTDFKEDNEFASHYRPTIHENNLNVD